MLASTAIGPAGRGPIVSRPSPAPRRGWAGPTATRISSGLGSRRRRPVANRHRAAGNRALDPRDGAAEAPRRLALASNDPGASSYARERLHAREEAVACDDDGWSARAQRVQSLAHLQPTGPRRSRPAAPGLLNTGRLPVRPRAGSASRATGGFTGSLPDRRDDGLPRGQLPASVPSGAFHLDRAADRPAGPRPRTVRRPGVLAASSRRRDRRSS